MNNDDIFEEEVDEEAAAELERKRREEEARRAASEAYQKQTNPDPQYQWQNNNGYNYNGNPQYGNGPQGPGQNPYGYYNNYPRRVEKKTAVWSMVLGILSIVLFCSCINNILAIIAIVLGVKFLKYGIEPDGKRMAKVGIVTAIISIVMFFGSWIYMGSNNNLENLIMDNGNIEFYYDSDGLGDLYDQYQENNDFNNGLDNTL